MLGHELRRRYIAYFQERGHVHLPGAPLVPIDALGVEDTTTLFTSAGMQQFKPYFTGAAAPPSGRVVTVQKCVRTGDIDDVGDYSHCTFFEMLGNFSFGDYFKAEVIPWTWEFLTEVVGFEPDRLCATVFEDDDEAFQVWHDAVGLPVDRIHRLGEDKNYWPANVISAGPNGPCGPCTEVFYRVAPEAEMTADPALTPTQRYKVDDAAGRWLEVWNNVFTQFDRTEVDGRAVLNPLPSKNNDTGAGFERIVAVRQGKSSVYDTDLFQPLMARVEDLARRRYGGTMDPADFAFRVVAEHARTMAFCIGDGVLPSNEGRGYVLRRIMRRAIRFGKTRLGFDEPFLHEVAPAVLDAMGEAYPEIVDRREHILKTIHAEEERFRRTLDAGSRRLEEALARDPDATELPGFEAFTLYDTYGFPLELTQEIAAERGVEVDVAGYEEALGRQREKSREAMSHQTVFGNVGAALSVAEATQFVGYTALASETVILDIVREGRSAKGAGPGEEVDIVLASTPFYAESGGQVGDRGTLTAANGGSLTAQVMDTRKTGGVVLHAARIVSGEAVAGMPVRAEVDAERRRAIMRNHTATHLLHAALRSVLGAHVHQQGSLVAPDRLRFDFTHTAPMTADELRSVEHAVNAAALADAPVQVTEDVTMAEARARGAMALFGEKYGDRVRVVEVPGASVELCGGTHLQHTSQVGLFKVVSETGVAAGVRRIEAVTGAGAYELVNRVEETVETLARTLKSSPRDVTAAAEKLAARVADLEREVRRLKTSGGQDRGELTTTEAGGITVLTGVVPDADGEALSARADREAQRAGSAVVVLGSAAGGKALFVAKVTPDLVQRGCHAGNLVREVARLAGGGGGGRPDFAQAGGRNADAVPSALDAVTGLVAAQVA